MSLVLLSRLIKRELSDSKIVYVGFYYYEETDRAETSRGVRRVLTPVENLLVCASGGASIQQEKGQNGGCEIESLIYQWI